MLTLIQEGGTKRGNEERKTPDTNSGPMALVGACIRCVNKMLSSVSLLAQMFTMEPVCDTQSMSHISHEWKGCGAEPFISNARPLLDLVRHLIKVLSSILASWFASFCCVRSPMLRLPIIIKPVAHTASQMGQTEGRVDSPLAFWRDEERAAE